MSSLTNKKILLGITGGIAAYKSAEIARGLKKVGAEVRVSRFPWPSRYVRTTRNVFPTCSCLGVKDWLVAPGIVL